VIAAQIVGTLLLTAPLLLVSAPAAAQAAPATPAPERTASYSAASGGGLAAPQPTANEGDLRISRTVRTESFATLLYRAPGARASLDVTIRDVPPPTGTPDVLACPTTGAAWKAGTNQPIDAAPAYDCTGTVGFGALSEDGTTLSFALDPAFQVEPGVWSIALVPTPSELQVVVGVPSVASPFSLDLAAPEAGSFVAEPEFVTPTLEEPATDPATDAGGTDGGTGEALLPGGFAAAPSVGTGVAAQAPLLAGGADAALAAQPTAPAPILPAAAPPLLAQPAGVAEDLGSGRRLLALLVLAGGSAAVGYAAGQQRPGPRILGGRSRLGAPAAAAAVPVPTADDRPRGIGRFAKPREAAPRRLR
jgi:hypothetical protein